MAEVAKVVEHLDREAGKHARPVQGDAMAMVGPDKPRVPVVLTVKCDGKDGKPVLLAGDELGQLDHS
eukprot:1295373-Prorocentrum_lima.AAC.1